MVKEHFQRSREHYLSQRLKEVSDLIRQHHSFVYRPSFICHFASFRCICFSKLFCIKSETSIYSISLATGSKGSRCIQDRNILDNAYFGLEGKVVINYFLIYAKKKTHTTYPKRLHRAMLKKG